MLAAQRPGPARRARHRAARREFHHHRFVHRGRDVLRVVDELEASRDLTGGEDAGRLARIPVRRHHRPAVGRKIQLVHAHLVLLPPPHETGVEKHKRAPARRVITRRVVPGRKVAATGRRGLAGHREEAVVADQLGPVRRDGRVVEKRSVRPAHIHQIQARRIAIRPVRSQRTPHAHLVAAKRIEPAERQEQIIITGAGMVQDVGRLDARVVAADQLFPVTLPGQRTPGRGVHAQDKNPARVGPVNHPEHAVRVAKQRRIDRVGMPVRVVDRAVRAYLVPHAAAQQHRLVRVGPGDRVRHGDTERAARRVARRHAVVEIVAPVVHAMNVRRPVVGRPRPLDGLGKRGRWIGKKRRARHPRPAEEIRRARRRQVRAKHIVRVAHANDRGIVHRDVAIETRRRGLRSQHAPAKRDQHPRRPPATPSKKRIQKRGHDDRGGAKRAERSWRWRALGLARDHVPPTAPALAVGANAKPGFRTIRQNKSRKRRIASAKTASPSPPQSTAAPSPVPIGRMSGRAPNFVAYAAATASACSAPKPAPASAITAPPKPPPVRRAP